jgi:hypothetical protein
MDVLFHTTNEKIVYINHVHFHRSLLLSKISYFQQFEDVHISMNFSKKAIQKLKQKLYNQPIDWEIEDADFIIECHKLSQIIAYKLFNESILYHLCYKWSDAHIIKIINEFGLVICDIDKYVLLMEHITNNRLKLFNMALHAQKGINEKQNFEKALSIYEQDWKENKNEESLQGWAFLHIRGYGVGNQECMVFNLLLQTWEQTRNSQIQNFLGYCYARGFGCLTDGKKAFDLFEQNWEEHKNLQSKQNLAYCYEVGIGCETDSKKAYDMLHSLWKEFKYPPGLHAFARCVLLGVACEKNEELAFQLFRQNWEENNYKESGDQLKKMYIHGIGCTKDVEKASELK